MNACVSNEIITMPEASAAHFASKDYLVPTHMHVIN